MVASRLLSLLAVLTLTAGAGSARARQLIDVHLDDKVPAGRRPRLTVKAFVDLGGLELELRRDDGRRFHQRQDNVPRDSSRHFELPQERGRHRWRGSLTVILPGGVEAGAMQLDFACEVVASLGLRVERRRLDLERRSLELEAARPLQRVELTVIDDRGRVAHRAEHALQQPRRRVRLDWPAHPGRLLKIVLLATAASGISERLELVPWHYAIPHQEVVFDTGSWEIKPTEVPKLEDSYRLLEQGIARYGKLLEVKLYIAGYTDTVAGADYNLRLSTRRARAIAAFFRERGFAYPIFYQGFGERGLKVPTPDETDEPRNRRAEYVLAAEPPPLEVPGAELHWQRLQ